MFTVNADDRESNMVFSSKSNEIEEDDDNEELQVPSDDGNDGATGSKPNKNFLSSIDWNTEGAGTNSSDDEFENLRDKDHDNTSQQAHQTHNFFSEREGVGNDLDENLDLFNLKSPSGDEFNTDLLNFKTAGETNGHLFNLDDDDSDSDDPSYQVDLLNLGSGQQNQGVSSKPTSHISVVDDMGVDLLNLSPAGSKDSQNVDLVSGTEKSPHRKMKRNKSADDVLSPGLHEDDDFFNQMGSRSSSSSRENVTSFTVAGADSATFDPFQTTRTKSPDLSSGGNGREPASSDLFDPFSSKSPSSKPSDEFDLFGAKPGQGSSSTETFPPLSTNNGGSNLNSFDPFGKTSTEQDLFGIGGSQAPTTTAQAQTQSNTDLFGDWGDSSSETLQPSKVPSPIPQRAPTSPAPQNKPTATPSDPFSDFGNLTSNLPKFPSVPTFKAGTSTSPKPQKKPESSTSGNPSWSRPAQQQSWHSGAKPSGPSKVPQKPNYAPSYSMSGSSGVFGSYGQKWSGKNVFFLLNYSSLISIIMSVDPCKSSLYLFRGHTSTLIEGVV